SLDDGGIRGMSELVIIEEIMYRLKHLKQATSLPKPCDYFDIIGGVGTGGVIALMLGRLRMPIDLAIKKYVDFSKKVYSDIKMFGTAERFKASTFVSAMEDILQSAELPADVLMQEKNPSCRSFVTALPSANMTPRHFRSYEVRANQGYNCTVVEAARATTASPGFFKAVSIGSGWMDEEFIGAHLGHNNPTRFVLEEAELVFGASQPVACIVSIGAGHPGCVSWVSTNSFTSEFMKVLFDISTSCETSVETLVKQYKNVPGIFYRLNVDQGLQKMALDDWNKLGEIKSHSVSYLHKAEITQKVDSIVECLHKSPQKITLTGTILPSTPKQEMSVQRLLPIVPAPSLLFTGREDILSQLEQYLVHDSSLLEIDHQHRFVLYGLGGAGKTQIVLQFCHIFKNRFSSIYMIDASSKESIEQFLVQVAHKAHLTEATSTAALVWFCYQTKWLMIFDNADDPDLDLWQFFPVCSHGNILITSRNEACTRYGPEHCYKVGNMTVEDSLSILLKASHRSNLSASEHTVAKKLVQELGCLALAIVQTGGYLNYNRHVKFYQYLENYKQNKSRYLGQVKTYNMDSYALSVFATWDLSYQKLDRKAKQVLMLCSVLHYAKVPIEIFKRAWNAVTQSFELDLQEIKEALELFVDKDGNWNDNSLEEALVTLRSYSLVEITGEDSALLNIHPLVHEWSYKSLSREKQTKAQIYAQQVFYYINKGGKLLQRQILQIHMREFGENHSYSIEARKNLAITLREAGKLQDAEHFGWHAMKAQTKAFGSSHPDTIRAMENLATILSDAGKSQEAEHFQQQVLEARMEVFGSSHPETIRAMEILAIIWRKAGKLQEAEDFQQQVLRARTEAFGSSHPETIRTMEILAIIWREAGKLQEAEDFQQQVLKCRMEAFGSGHPETIRTMENIAIIWREAGMLQEAEDFQQQVSKARMEAFGSSHPETIKTMENLATILSDAGKLQEAEHFQQQVFKARMEGFGSSHPETIRAMEILAIIWRKAGKLQEAEDYQQQVLNARIEVFGSSHSETIRTMEILAIIWREAGKLQEAEDFQQQVLKARMKAFDSSHPNTIRAMENLATILSDAGKLQEAEDFQRQVLKARIEVFGSSHPETIRAMEILAIIWRKAGKLQEAEDFQQQVLKSRMEAFGSSHPTTIRAMKILAMILKEAGKLQEVEDF
ncbi:Nephrocystin-3, partial [Termitomyces sp. J132]